MKELPIACTLTATATAERIEWLGRLGRDGLVADERQGTKLDLRFDRATDFPILLSRFLGPRQG